MSRIIVLTILYLSQLKHKSLQIDKLACRQKKYGHAGKRRESRHIECKQTNTHTDNQGHMHVET
jgi:hypothetical protein